jgi:hypothetical protein
MTESKLKEKVETVSTISPTVEVPTSQQQKEVEIKETKLTIENKEFEIIPYRVEKDTKWYIPELGLMIRKTQKGNPIEGYDKEYS